MNLFLLSAGNHPVFTWSFYLFQRLLLAGLSVWLLTSCGTHDLPGARGAFYQGNYDLAEEEIGSEGINGGDAVLLLMERGTIYQAGGEYEKSSMDYIRANDILDKLETYSLSEGAGSWIINDTVYSFEGAPFEQTLLHSFTALNHLAQGGWSDGGVEARRIIYSLRPENRGVEYPDDAFSRYLAAFILQMTGDRTNSGVQYQLAGELVPGISIDKHGGVWPAENNENPREEAATGQELVCFFLLGHSPTMREVRNSQSHFFLPPRIKLYDGDHYLGEGTVLTSTADLALTTWRLGAAARFAKSAARIAAKEATARALDEQDEALGALARIILIGLLERPDFRRWETLPRWLAVARVPCSSDLSSFDVRFEGGGYGPDTVITVQRPLVKKGNVFYSFVRDLPGFNTAEKLE